MKGYINLIFGPAVIVASKISRIDDRNYARDCTSITTYLSRNYHLTWKNDELKNKF